VRMYIGGVILGGSGKTAKCRMSDSESSGESSETSVPKEEVKPLPLLRNDGDADKLEEFQKLLRSMMDSRVASPDEDEPQDETNNILKSQAGMYAYWESRR
jgi:hypothetical protein